MLYYKSKSKKKRLFSIIIIIVFGIYAGNAWIFSNGIVQTHDGGLNILYFIAIDDNLKSGNFPPYWNSNAYGGSGEPLYFWNPLSSYLVEFIHIFEKNFFKSVTYLVPITFILSGSTFFLMMQKITKKWNVSLISSVFYMYAPYRFTDSNIRGDFAEGTAFIFFPLAVFFLLKITDKNSHKILKSLILGGISLGLIILAHPLMFYLFIFFVFIPLAFYKTIHLKNFKTLFYFSIIFVVSLGLTSFYWLPVISEIGFIQSTDFIIKHELVNYPLSFKTLFLNEESSTLPGSGLHLFLGFPALASFLISPLFFKRNKPLIILTLFTLFIIFLTTNFGIPFLKVLPGIEYQQFPFRLLAIVTFTTSIILGIVVSESLKFFNRKNLNPNLTYWISFGLVIMIFLTSYSMANDIFWIVEEPTREQMCCYSPYVKTFLPTTVPSEYYDKLQERFPAEIKNVKKHEFREDLLKSYVPLPTFEIKTLSGTVSNNDVKVSIDSPTKWEIKTNLSEDSVIIFRIFYYPGWHVYLDGNLLPEKYESETGYISALVPKGEHEIVILFEDTFVRYFGKIISIISIVIISSFLFIYLKIGNFKIKKTNHIS